MQVSIIIPTYNEAGWVGRLVRFLRFYGGNELAEIIVSDGGSTDNTVAEAQRAGAKVVRAPQKGRAHQMNFGAQQSSSNLLYFVHADVVPPASFITDIKKALSQGFKAGRFTMWFKSKRPALVVNALFSHLNLLWCSGGDQSLFVTQPLWEQMQGFDPYFVIMEEYDFMRRLRSVTTLKIIHKAVLTTDRKYKNNGYLKVNLANLKAFLMWRQGRNPKEIKRFYFEKLQS
jgi:rSAM/selenodomain-associated transferase 2